jgi:hypothetical protein
VFVAHPPAGLPQPPDLHLVRAARRSFTGPAEFLADPASRARVGEYLADMVRPYAHAVPGAVFGQVPAALFGEPPSPALGQSYGEMAGALIGPVVSTGEPVDLLVLAFSIHDLWPARPTAAYLSHLTPGTPMAFALCDQGSAAAFSGLRIARAYAASADVRRALLIVVEQAALPYDSPAATVPAQHRGVAMLYGDALHGDAEAPLARFAAVRQHPGVAPGDVASRADADLAELSAGHHDVGLVVSAALAEVWSAPAAKRVQVMPPGQPSTDVWWGLIDELTGDADHPDLLLAADYDPGLRYLCFAAFSRDGT